MISSMTTTTSVKNLRVGDRFQTETRPGKWSRLRVVVAVGFTQGAVTVTSAPVDQTDRTTAQVFQPETEVRVWR